MTDKGYIDFHTHHPSLRGEHVIQDGINTRGRHPWRLLPGSSQEGESYFISLKKECEKGLLAIGESGLDRLCTTPYDLQISVFSEEVKFSETFGLPLFLHCVRAIDDVLRIRRELHAKQPIIWHGYRGNAEQLRQLKESPVNFSNEADRGLFYFSFGHKYNADAVRICPLNRLLLETDEDVTNPIAGLYLKIAELRELSLDSLVRQMHDNFHTLFPNARL